MKPLAVTAFTTTNPAGVGNAATLSSLREGRTGLAPNTLDWAPIPCWVGAVADAARVAMPEALRDYDCANARLALLALEQDGFREAVLLESEKGKPCVGAVVVAQRFRHGDAFIPARGPATAMRPARPWRRWRAAPAWWRRRARRR